MDAKARRGTGSEEAERETWCYMYGLDFAEGEKPERNGMGMIDYQPRAN